MMDVTVAITKLRPGAKFSIHNDVIEWHDEEQTQPTQQEIDDIIAAQEYRDLRANAYPAITDQLDALWKGGTAADDMHEQILAVKAQYPKPQ